jgi:hypothetical protein
MFAKTENGLFEMSRTFWSSKFAGLNFKNGLENGTQI